MNILRKMQQGKAITLSDLNKPVALDEILNYINAPSLVDLLKVKSDMGNGVFLFRGQNQLGAVLKVESICINNQSVQAQREILTDIRFALTHSVPNEYSDQWISQVFVIKDSSPDRAIKKINQYVDDDYKGSKFSQEYLKTISEHLQDLSKKGFIDKNANDQLWVFNQLDIYLTLYQEKQVKVDDVDALSLQYNKTIEVLERTQNAFKQVGILMREVSGSDYVAMIARFFHNKEIKLAKSSLQTFESDLSEIALDKTKTTYDKGLWQFNHKDQKKHTCFLRIDGIDDDNIKAGHLSSEQRDRLSLLDRLPSDSIYTQTIVHVHEDTIKDILAKIISRSKGTSAEVVKNRKNAEQALVTMADGDLIYRFTAGIFVASDSEADLDKKTRSISASFNAKGLTIIKPDDNPLCQDDFITALPFGYNYSTDQRFYKKNAFLTQSSTLAKLSPFYSREKGTGSPLFTFFNRGGESVFFDPLKDYSENAFALIFGGSGSGKSATLVYMVMQLIAVYNPRIFIIEKGESFSLLVKYCESLGLSTHRIVVNSSQESMPLSPFANAIKVLEQDINELDTKDDEVIDEVIDENRDILNELIIIAKLMITGGEAEEEKRFRRHHRFDVGNAIYLAAKTCKDEDRVVLTQDVINALKIIATQKTSDKEKDVINSFADSMNVFISSKADKKIFNTPGEAFPEVDITQFDVGSLGDAGNEDKLVVAFISLMMNINNIAERDQHDKRPILVLGDEAHLYATNPLLAPYIVKIAKMWRKLGAWLWLATQSLEDFEGPSKRMINTMEWLILLSLKTKEIETLKKFIDLSPEQETLLKATVEQKRRYKEGVVFNQTNTQLRFLFRNIPPPLALALGMTAPDEKTQRQQIMKQHNIGELEAVFKVAEQIKGNIS